MADPEITKEVANHYDNIAVDYSDRYTGETGRYFERLETDIMFEMIDINPPVLDLGTGTGRLADRASAEGVNPVIGVDISPKILQHARDQVMTDSVTFAQMDARSLAIPDRTVNTVLSLGMFEYIDDLTSYFQEVRRILTDNGSFAFSVHNANRFIPRETSGDAGYSLAEHSLEAIRESLAAADMRLNSWHGSMWYNKAWWYAMGATSKLPGTKLLKLTNTVAIRLQRWLDKNRWFRYRSGTLIVSATPI